MLSLYAQFDVYGPGDEMGVFQLVGEVVVIVVVVMGVVNIVGVVATEGGGIPRNAMLRREH